jgi:hypothetical protein
MTTRAVAILKGLLIRDDSEIPEDLGVSVERFGVSLLVMRSEDLSDAGCIAVLTMAAEQLVAKFKPPLSPTLTIVCDEADTLIIPIRPL